MPYITVKNSPAYKQITFEDVLFGKVDPKKIAVNHNETGTRTHYTNHIKGSVLEKIDIQDIINKLAQFCDKYESLYSVERKKLYHSFPIPKKSGGLRRIDAPNDDLKEALRELLEILSNDTFASYHTSAFAYIKGRSPIDAMRKHQANESMWFLKTDFTDFFGSTTHEFLMKILSEIFPFSEIIRDTNGEKYLSKALDLCFLNGGLPQGTPTSPMLTNLMMIPIDHKICNSLHNFKDKSFVYTRFADDIQISCKIDFNFTEVIDFMKSVLTEFEAPFDFKPKKTRYGSRNGSNWNLGIMLNKDNNLTVGHKNKKNFRAMITNYLLDWKAGVHWDIEDVQSLAGLFSHYHSIEPKYFDNVVRYNQTTYGLNLLQCFKEDIYG